MLLVGAGGPDASCPFYMGLRGGDNKKKAAGFCAAFCGGGE
jgi:hypothetical protein